MNRVFPALLLAIGFLAGAVDAQSSGRPGHGLIGYGITMYQPRCAHACRSSLPRSSVPCDVHLHGHHSSSVSAECLAHSEAYLLSAAWCFHVRCASEELSPSTLERFWEMDLVGRELEQPLPKWTYQESLKRVVDGDLVPTKPLGEDEPFNRTVLVLDEDYLPNWNGNTAFENTEVFHQKFSIIILVTGAGLPMLLSLVRFIPLPARIVSWFYSCFIDAPAFGRHHAAPILGLGLVPTRGQALFILYILALNVVFTAVGYRPLRPNSWYALGAYEEVFNYVANRAGMLSFANLPLVVLYAGRNNVLLWLTNWSHSTFLLLHRWIAVICMVQAVLHSAMWLHIHVAWHKDHAEVAALEYWIWGIIATLALVLLMPFSLLPLRKRLYEFFHAAHIVLAVLAIVGCWYHIIYRYKRQWGYENWVIMAAVIWSFDWVLRVSRILGRGSHKAFITKIDDEYFRLDVPGVYCHGHVYAYFPTLTWRIWESHPLSVAGLSYTTPNQRAVKAPGNVKINSSKGINGTAFLVRVEKGTTSLLAKHSGNTRGIPILLEPYTGDNRHSNEATQQLSTAQHSTIFIAGGVGITNILPKIVTGQTVHSSESKLYWGVRSGSSALVGVVQDLVQECGVAEKTEVHNGSTDLQWGSVPVRVSIGERLDLRALLTEEIDGSKGSTTVVVCGPPSMADEVRMIVTAKGRQGSVVKLVEESFMW